MMLFDINQCVIIFLFTTVTGFIVYASYMLYRMRNILNETQERRISTIILMMLFFVLAVMYDLVWERNTFLGVWFIYAMYHAVKETRRVVCIEKTRRSTDKAVICQDY